MSDPESAAYRPGFASGGGFSNIYAQPDYQKHAVAAYFANHNPNYTFYEGLENENIGADGGIYNRLGRG